MKAKTTLKPTSPWQASHKIIIPTMTNDEDAMKVENAVYALSGIKEVDTDLSRNQLLVRYDASKLAYNTILDALQEVGLPPINTWWSRIKSNWFQYADTNAMNNAAIPDRPCCNKPPRRP